MGLMMSYGFFLYKRCYGSYEEVQLLSEILDEEGGDGDGCSYLDSRPC